MHPGAMIPTLTPLTFITMVSMAGFILHGDMDITGIHIMETGEDGMIRTGPEVTGALMALMRMPAQDGV